jgi:hypothetical protein
MRKLMGSLKNFLKLSFKLKLLVIGSFILLYFFRLLIKLIPSKRLTILMGTEMQESPALLDKITQNKALWVGWAINRVSNHIRWDNKCLTRAITGQYILKLLHIPSTIYLGVAKEDSNKMIAHAWLRSGDQFIIGAEEKDKFQSVTCFSK